MAIRGRLLSAVAAASVLLVGASVLTPAQAAGRWTSPATMSSLGGNDQVVVVQAGNLSTTYAWLTAWERRGGAWVKVRGPVQARLGYSGLSNRAPGDRRQNDGSTPTGSYGFGIAFGSGVDPGTSMYWRRFNANDYWTYDPLDPKTYNAYQVSRPRQAKWRLVRAERLASYGKQYEFAAVIKFNAPRGLYYDRGQFVTKTPANTRLGGGIFLHVNGPGATAGCVSIPRNDMRAIIRWLDPAKNPRIVIGTPQILSTI